MIDLLTFLIVLTALPLIGLTVVMFLIIKEDCSHNSTD
jgi:hypothetical protein